MHFGAAYYPEYWPRERWATDALEDAINRGRAMTLHQAVAHALQT